LFSAFIISVMKIYLVGGAVRDKLLNFPVTERDWVVIGETPESMLANGFKAVGKDFPVFLHPQTHDEYALARTERKTAPGYKGFSIHASPEVTLQEDLIRRDLTINALAMTANGEIIDPYGGQQDIERKILRHISPAFSEDPVRVLRVARFSARYAHLGFTIAPETQQLMQQMVKNGEIDYLVPERVWAETAKALSETTPRAFFDTLKDSQALVKIFPEIDCLFGVPQPPKHHPEIDTGIHSFMCLEQAAKLTNNPIVRFSALVHDLGKALTPQHILPAHHGHETAGLPVLDELCRRLRIPNQYKKMAAQVMRHHTHCHKAFDLRAATIAKMFADMGMYRADADLSGFLLACEADARGRKGFENRPYPQAEFLRSALQAAKKIDISVLMQKNLQGPVIGQAIHELRVKAIKQNLTA
jgi:tRNA nucleotidyltransferase (CCA-adding enzyme)